MRTFSADCCDCRKPIAVFTADNDRPLERCPFCPSGRLVFTLLTPACAPPRPASEAEVQHPLTPTGRRAGRRSPSRLRGTAR